MINFLNSISNLVLNIFGFLVIPEITYIIALLLVIYVVGWSIVWLKL